jgi:hypothetical protein
VAAIGFERRIDARGGAAGRIAYLFMTAMDLDENHDLAMRRIQVNTRWLFRRNKVRIRLRSATVRRFGSMSGKQGYLEANYFGNAKQPDRRSSVAGHLVAPTFFRRLQKRLLEEGTNFGDPRALGPFVRKTDRHDSLEVAALVNLDLQIRQVEHQRILSDVLLRSFQERPKQIE